LPAHCGGFRRQRLASNASCPVVAGAVIRSVADVAVIYVDVNIGVYVVDGTVIVETTSAPVPALVARAAVAESIINSAVVTDILAPEAIVVAIPTVVRSPISGSPQIAHFRRQYPSTRHPIIALGSIAPVSGRPQIAIAGTFRLRIFRQLWWGLLCQKHRLAVARILVVAIGLVIGIIL
jgi:hypothetical protein